MRDLAQGQFQEKAFSGAMERYIWLFETRRHLRPARREAKQRTCHAGSETVSPSGRWKKCPGRFTMRALTPGCRPSVPTATWRETSRGQSNGAMDNGHGLFNSRCWMRTHPCQGRITWGRSERYPWGPWIAGAGSKPLLMLTYVCQGRVTWGGSAVIHGGVGRLFSEDSEGEHAPRELYLSICCSC